MDLTGSYDWIPGPQLVMFIQKDIELLGGGSWFPEVVPGDKPLLVAVESCL